MTEKDTHLNNKGVTRMKKRVLFVALVMVFVFAFASVAFAKGSLIFREPEVPIRNQVFSPTGALGAYLDWDLSVSEGYNTGSSPHGNYSASTNKCAVCHSVHQATAGGAVLTAGGTATSGDSVWGYANYSEGCSFCHAAGNTFTNVTVTLGPGGTITPHTSCDRCHAANPHGVGTSKYPTLASRLLNSDADVDIEAELLAGTNGVQDQYFDGTAPFDSGIGITLATGYLCGSCHTSVSLAVNTASIDPVGGVVGKTGHRVWAGIDNPYVTTYGGSYTGGQVAWAAAQGCAACHDAKNVANATVFPHNYVDSVGAPTADRTVGSLMWMTNGSYFGSADNQIVTGDMATQGNDLLTRDGLCLKCHRADATTNGVGLSF